MTNLDETGHADKYENLEFVEFLECLCRVAVVYFEGKPLETERLEERVAQVLDLIW
jgi:hypothetical protein